MLGSLCDIAMGEVRSNEGPTKSAQLRALLGSNELEFLMEAHSGISARIVEEAGFRGVWASGLALSAQLGVRDASILLG